MDKEGYIIEPERKTKVIANVDVAVVGGGPAGLCAAIASARNGAKTILIEKNDCLGGLWAKTYSSYGGTLIAGISFQNWDGKHIIKGIGWEIIQRLMRRGAAAPLIKRKKDEVKFRNKTRAYINFPPAASNGPAILNQEKLKGLALEMVQEENIILMLHTMGVDVIKNVDEIKGIIIQSKSGRQAILSKVVIDCTADADIAAAGRVPFEIESKDKLWRMAYALLIDNVDSKKTAQYLRDHPDFLTASFFNGFYGWKEAKQGDAEVSEDRLTTKLKSPRHYISTGRSSMRTATGYFSGDPTNVWDLTKAEIEGRNHALKEFLWLRENIPGYELSKVVDRVGLGIRESRRIIGEYIITENDISKGQKFDDSIGLNNMPFDMHNADGSWEDKFVKKTSEIPYRCMIPKKIENLLVAGRCISCTHIAQASLRKVPICCTTGQAAGTAAALSVKMNLKPRNLDYKQLQKELRKQNVIVKLEDAIEWIF